MPVKTYQLETVHEFDKVYERVTAEIREVQRRYWQNRSGEEYVGAEQGTYEDLMEESERFQTLVASAEKAGKRTPTPAAFVLSQAEETLQSIIDNAQYAIKQLEHKHSYHALEDIGDSALICTVCGHNGDV